MGQGQRQRGMRSRTRTPCSSSPHTPLCVPLPQNEDAQASTDVKHLVLRCGWQERAGMIGDMIAL